MIFLEIRHIWPMAQHDISIHQISLLKSDIADPFDLQPRILCDFFWPARRESCQESGERWLFWARFFMRCFTFSHSTSHDRFIQEPESLIMGFEIFTTFPPNPRYKLKSGIKFIVDRKYYYYKGGLFSKTNQMCNKNIECNQLIKNNEL